MKRMIGAIAVFGMVTLAYAQTDAPAFNTAAPAVTLVGDSMGTAPNRGTQLRGAIEVALPGGARITADEADVDHSSGSVDLRGNVRITLSPADFPKWDIRIRKP